MYYVKGWILVGQNFPNQPELAVIQRRAEATHNAVKWGLRRRMTTTRHDMQATIAPKREWEKGGASKFHGGKTSQGKSRLLLFCTLLDNWRMEGMRHNISLRWRERVSKDGRMERRAPLHMLPRSGRGNSFDLGECSWMGTVQYKQKSKPCDFRWVVLLVFFQGCMYWGKVRPKLVSAEYSA